MRNGENMLMICCDKNDAIIGSRICMMVSVVCLIFIVIEVTVCVVQMN